MMNGSTRPYLPPSLNLLVAGEDGSATLRQQEEERMRKAAFEAGHRRGVEEGLSRGRAEGTADAETAAAARLEAEVLRRARQGASLAAEALESLLAKREEERQALDTAMRQTIAAAMEILAPTLFAHTTGAEISALVTEALAERGEDIILLTAHPDTLAAMKQDGFPQPQDTPPRLRLLPEPSMPPGSAEASWVNGGLVHRPHALLSRVQAILGTTGTTPLQTETSQELTP